MNSWLQHTRNKRRKEADHDDFCLHVGGWHGPHGVVRTAGAGLNRARRDGADQIPLLQPTVLTQQAPEIRAPCTLRLALARQGSESSRILQQHDLTWLKD